MSASKLIRDTRQANHLTQRQLARKALTVQSAISRLECGVTSPTIQNLEHILAAMGYTLHLVARKAKP